jgi:hypothetical protein
MVFFFPLRKQTSSDAFVLSDPVVSDQTARSGGLRSEVDEEKFPQQHAAHSVSGFKLRQSMDCALDTAIIKVCDFASPGAKAMRMTPNILTTISVVFKLLALYSLHFAKSKQLFVVFASLAYVFDCFGETLVNESQLFIFIFHPFLRRSFCSEIWNGFQIWRLLRSYQ